MKYMKRAKIYKSNNVTFNPETCEAHSYKWWKFVHRVDGVVIFNNHNYSNTTSKHQSKVRSLLNELNIKIDIIAPFPGGIPNESIENLILMAEENTCDSFISEQAKVIRRSENAKAKREMMKARELDRAQLAQTIAVEQTQTVGQ